MNNLKQERERIKIQKQLYRENKLIREKKENNEIPTIIPQKSKKQLATSSLRTQFSSIPSEKLYDNSITDDVSLTDMLGIKPTDGIFNNVKNSNDINEQAKLENDRHYAPDFI